MTLTDFLGEEGAVAVAAAIKELEDADQAVKQILVQTGRSYDELVEQGETTDPIYQSMYAADEKFLDVIWMILNHALPVLADAVRTLMPELDPDLACYLDGRDTWPEEILDLLDDFASALFSQPSDEDDGGRDA